MKRYEKFADQLATLMTTGVLTPGERLPSVRSASRTHGISPSTVFQAYYLLESRGLIEARERSGYFVREPARSHDAAPVLAPLEGTEVAVSDLVYSVLQSLQDPDIVPFGSAFPSPDLFPLARLARSMAHGLRDLPAHDLTAYVTPGHPELRRQIARRYGLAGMPDVGEELVITHGALEALNLGLQSLTRPGDLVAVESPAFYASLQVLERLQLKAVEIPVDPERGLNVDALAEALGRLPIKACWFMSGLQNPTGVSLDDRAQQRLYGLLQRHQVPLLEDDVYAELYSGSEPHRPIKRFDSEGLVLHCGSFSKCLAPGYRIGWIAAGRQAGAVARLRLMTTITPSMPAQAALADYLQHGGYDRHLRRLRLALDRQRQAMLAAARRYFPAETRISRPQGGYFLWFELPAQVDSLALYRQALAEGISLAPGPIFSAQQGFRHCIRLNCGPPWDARSEAAMATLGELLKAF
ncbi:PLP-dependent aminotransferase family protein [Pseudomonas oryzihabitans]|uniref:aminotransferase-like domain-containing protein n=1 Tax=Pseudomonas oryzihabitans TaxID=47885 RepID=UPI00111EE1AB|nr:PLP-dependent aminotransferase family protein [Pseudomonas psychrotolerans]QDD89990.1 GntR family transcriptional regulator [Pseudomonas psychrotolerans]